ncbi:hypothetical protein [Bdellovibrio sp. HCB209]|uniref:hypothetical protein n=1 Tax=Bdellovibrio sp. HCB209 TaxID=3394354 RepID=UPI0039B693C7
MKALMSFVLMSFLVVPAFAKKTIWVTGTGSASGSCKGGDSFCPRNLQSRAEGSAKSNANMACTMKQGVSVGLPSCSSHCSPGYISPGNSAWVRCDANCRLSCRVDDKVFGIGLQPDGFYEGSDEEEIY